jgi:predicted phosphate transport protein (TIGR00153 family)
MSLPIGSLPGVQFPGVVPRDRVFFDLFNQAGKNTLRAARMLEEMLRTWPDDAGLAREILLAEQEGDKITHDIVQRTNTTSTPIDADDIYALATKVDDVVDFTEETADFMGLYQIEAPMEQAQAMADVLVKSCEQLAAALADLRGFEGLEQYLIEIHRLENEGDRLYRDAVAALFANGIDPMIVIRWKDIFTVLERAIDATETAAHILEGIVIKNA